MKKLFLALFVCLASYMPLLAQLPKLVLTDTQGKQVDVSTLVGKGRPVIISFFATWCKPCLNELSAIAEVYEDWQEETKVELIAVSIDQGTNMRKVKPLFESRGWKFRALLDSNSELKRQMGVVGVPTVFVFDEKGKQIGHHIGYAEGAEQQILDEIKSSRRKK